jgi:hypothetical protein
MAGKGQYFLGAMHGTHNGFLQHGKVEIWLVGQLITMIQAKNN